MMSAITARKQDIGQEIALRKEMTLVAEADGRPEQEEEDLEQAEALEEEEEAEMVYFH